MKNVDYIAAYIAAMKGSMAALVNSFNQGIF